MENGGGPIESAGSAVEKGVGKVSEGVCKLGNSARDPDASFFSQLSNRVFHSFSHGLNPSPGLIPVNRPTVSSSSLMAAKFLICPAADDPQSAV